VAAQRDVGDRLERAIEDRADLEGEIARGEAAGPPERRDLEKLAPAWLVAMAVLQALAIASLCALQRLAVRAKRWGPVVTSQLVGNAMAKIAPGGGAVGAAVQYRMLVDAGLNGATVVGGLTVANLLVFAFVLAMPVLAIPAVVPHDLVNATLIGAAVFAVLAALGPRWPRALLAATGRWAFDYATLLAALAAGGRSRAPAKPPPAPWPSASRTRPA
jgi:uncharacterized membrane protein YbhN (UPF0104 family)